MKLLPLLLTVVVGVALWATSATAQVSATGTPAGKGCTQWTLCNDQEATGTCELDLAGDGGDVYFIRPTSEYTWTAFTQDSDSTAAYEVQLYSTSQGLGYDADHRAPINSDLITVANPMYSWSGIMGDIHAELSGTVTDGVTVVIKGCMLQGP